MLAANDFMPSSLDQLDSPEHHSWREHWRLLLHIPRARVWRGCLGLGLVTTDPFSGVPALDRLLVPDRDIRWVSLVDLPRGSFRLRRSREVHWATVHRTKVRFGMPALGGAAEAAYDFRAMPFDRLRRGRFVVRHGLDVLNPSKEPRLFRALNALNWAMTSTAFSYRAAWQEWRSHFFDATSTAYDLKARVLLFGESRFDHVPAPKDWMPRAYVAFKHSHREKLFDWSTGGSLERGRRHYPNGLKRRLCEDVTRSMPVYASRPGRFLGTMKSHFRGLPTLDLAFAADGNGRRTITVTRQARIRLLPSQVVRAGDVVATELCAPVRTAS